ncbi:acyl carrier protein, partial [Streptomyces sp. MUM 2J]|uniref:acyl carrier protein n=1 Tax=Streptomyces sp. MUM 2J TaxID=2791987 RepID=UPI001F043AAE
SSGMTGRLAAADRARLARLGIAPLSTAEALELFDAALATEAPAVVAARFDPAALRSAIAEEHLPLLLGSLVEEADARPEPTPPVSLKAQLEDLAEPERARLVLDAVRGEVAAVLGHDSVDEVDVEAELMDLGFDSLTAVELRNRLNAMTGLRLSSTLVFDYPTTLELAEYLYGELAP